MQRSAFLLLAFLLPAILEAQIISGRAVDSASKRPIGKVKVTAIGVDSSQSLGDMLTDKSGVFYFHLGRGAYHLKFDVGPTTLFLPDTFVLADTDFVEREFILALPEDAVFTQVQADTRADFKRAGFRIRYPEPLFRSHVTGVVRVAYVVDKRGRVEPASLAVVESSDPLFTTEVLLAMERIRFIPAEFLGRPVRQSVRQLFSFCFSDAAPQAPRPPCGKDADFYDVSVDAFSWYTSPRSPD